MQPEEQLVHDDQCNQTATAGRDLHQAGRDLIQGSYNQSKNRTYISVVCISVLVFGGLAGGLYIAKELKKSNGSQLEKINSSQ